MNNEGYAQQGMDMAKADRESAFRNLSGATEKLHTDLGILEEMLGPVLRPPTPMAELEHVVEAESGLDEQVKIVMNGSKRVRALISRLAV